MQIHAPVDPGCPKVRKFRKDLYEDPMSRECGCLGEILESWEKRHRQECSRCREHALQNVEVG